MNIKLLTEYYLEFLSLKGGCIGSSESTFVKMPHCWKSHVTAHFDQIVPKSISIFDFRYGVCLKILFCDEFIFSLLTLNLCQSQPGPEVIKTFYMLISR